MISEKLLHYIWRSQLFVKNGLKTVRNQPLSIIHQGFQLQDEGPDFKQAIIKVDGVTWAGNVEIHIRSSDWYNHNHQHNIKYNSVILHVVYEHDCDVFIEQAYPLPTLELQHLISSQLLLRYIQFANTPHQFPCEAYIKEMLPLTLHSFLTRLSYDRILRKQLQIFEILHVFSEDWEQTLFFILCQSIGFKTNAPAFEMLGKALPYKLLKRHTASHLQVSALIFGQTGMLEEELEDEYYQLLQNEYLYLKTKYRLITIKPNCWNMLRLRPKNFPCIRLAQLSEIIYNHPDLFEKVTTKKDILDYQNIFINKLNIYWDNHYCFGKKSNKAEKRMGRNSCKSLLINALIPFLFACGTFTGSNNLKEFSMQLLELLPFEENHITKKYKYLGFCAENAVHSQALLELQHTYCEKKQCMECALGQRIIFEP